jgi:ParB family chromosome partitioning protein
MDTANETIAFIALNKLTPWSGNVRKTGASDGIEELRASIAAHGVLQSLVVRKNSKGKFAVVAGRRRYLALSALAEQGAITADALVPCRIVSRNADAAEISLTENVVRAPMHPADQFEAFRDLVDRGSSVADVAARFGVSEGAVKKRLTLGRVSPSILAAYKGGDLTLEQVQAFAVTDNIAAQEQVFVQVGQWSDDPDHIRRALTQGDIPATDKRARFVTVGAYEQEGGALKRDLFTEGDAGIFLLDADLLDRLAREKLEAVAAGLRGEGWKWVEAHPDFDYDARDGYLRRRPEPLPLSEEEAAEESSLQREYESIYNTLEDDDEEASARLDAIEARIAQIEERPGAFTPETLALAGAVVTLGRNGEPEIIRGLVRPEDAQEGDAPAGARRERPELSASLVESLTEHRTAAIAAALSSRPDIALATVVHALAGSVFLSRARKGSVRIFAELTHLREDGKGSDMLRDAQERWGDQIPDRPEALWEWCLAQDQSTLLSLLAFCAARAVDAIQTKQADSERLAHAGALAKALELDMAQWFTPTGANFFSRVSRPVIVAAITQAKAIPAKRSWEKMKKSELAHLAEREIAGTGWLPQPLRA